MPKGKYTLADLAPESQPQGKYTAADLDTSTPPPVAGAGSYGVPGMPGIKPLDMKPSAFGRDASGGTVAQKVFGDKPFTNTVTQIAQHAKNMVAAPYHAFTDAPKNQNEQEAQDFGPGMLGVYRMGVASTVDNAAKSAAAFKAGDYGEAANKAADAIPVVGPWARSFENDASTYGVLPAMAGAATDIYAPKAAGAAFGGAMKMGGTALKAASTTPEALKVAATRSLVTGSPGELLNRSLKPPVKMEDFEESVEKSLPKIAPLNPKGVQGFSDAAKAAKQDVANRYNAWKAPVENDALDTTPLVQKQVASIPATNKFETPGIVKVTAQKASPYDMTPQSKTVNTGLLDQYGKPIQRIQTTTPTKPTLGTVDDIRMDTNAKLKQKLFDAPDKTTAMSDPKTARLAAVNDGTRDLVYDKIAKQWGIPEDEIRDNQELYGHLSDVAKVAGKRATVAGRANPLSLQESLQLHGNPIWGAYNFGTARMFKDLTDSDAVTNAALDRYRSPNAINFPPRPTTAGRYTSAAGNAVDRFSKVRPFLPAAIASKGYQQQSK